MKHLLALLILLSGPALALAQSTGGTPPPLTQEEIDQLAQREYQRRLNEARARRIAEDIDRTVQAERDGVQVRIKDIARFRGVRSNQIMGYGLVVGLEGTGDSKKSPFTAIALSNALKDFGTVVEAGALDAKNVATVLVTAELPPFTTPGNTIDVTVNSVGDAKSLQGGTLIQTALYGAGNKEQAMAVAMGPLSIGGFSAGRGGSSGQKNHVNVGRVPSGAIVERAVPYQMVFSGNTLYLELNEPDLTTAQRTAAALTGALPSATSTAIDGGTVQVILPGSLDPVMAMSLIESVEVYADVPAVVVVNERTGTIVVGGNVRIGPAVIAQGNLQVSISTENLVSQPAPFSGGVTTPFSNSSVEASEELAQVGILTPNATVADLARIFQAMKMTPRDIISILQALKQQGALKARLEIQ